MSTYETLDNNAIEDEYDVNEMERLDLLFANDDFVVSEPVHVECYW